MVSVRSMCAWGKRGGARKALKSAVSLWKGPSDSMYRQGPSQHPGTRLSWSQRPGNSPATRLAASFHLVLAGPPLTICLPTSLASERENQDFQTRRANVSIWFGKPFDVSERIQGPGGWSTRRPFFSSASAGQVHNFKSEESLGLGKANRLAPGRVAVQ